MQSQIQFLLDNVTKNKATYLQDNVQATTALRSFESDDNQSPQAFESEDTLDGRSTFDNPIATYETESSPTSDSQQQALEKAREAMMEANRIRVFSGDGDDETLTSCLLYMLRYNDDLDLCLGSFNALVYLISLNFVFAQTLKQVTILGTDERAANYLSARSDVSEFRRLRKWLHDPDECDRCTAVATKIINDWCCDEDGQNLLRNLNLEEYLLRLLRMKRTGVSMTPLKKLMRQCMRLVAAFCSKNPVNQGLFATRIDEMLVPWMREPEFYEEAANMIAAVVEENEVVSVGYSGLLMRTVTELSVSKEHGRNLMALNLLQKLLVVADTPVEASQVKICKGAFEPMARESLMDVNCDLDEDEWCEPGETGPAMSRITVIQQAANGSSARCEKAVVYYAKCLELLGICARGSMPATEMLCASLIPFGECIERLNEIYHLQDDLGYTDFLTEVNSELLTFFLDVFIDTTSEHILLHAIRPQNGLWVARDGTKDTPIANRLLDEIERRIDQAKSEVSAGGEQSRMFEEACLFFIHFACCIGPGMSSEFERHIVEDGFQSAQRLAQEATSLVGWTQREKALLQELTVVTQAYINNDEMQLNSAVVAENLVRLSRVEKEEHVCQNEAAWERFVAAAVSTIPVSTVRGTTRLVGQGMMSIAQSIWTSPDGKGVRYASFLVKPLRAHLSTMKKNVTRGMRDDIPRILTVLDTVRAVPYSVTAYSEDKLNSLFTEFVEVNDLNFESNPYLAGVQKEMVSQGWALLCLEIIVADELKDMRLAALRLLLAMTGGGNRDVQNELLEQLQDLSICPRSVCLPFALACSPATDDDA